MNSKTKLIAKYLLIPLASIMMFLAIYPKLSLLNGGIGYGLGHKAMIDFENSLLEAGVGNLFDKVALTDFKLTNIKLEILFVTIIYYGFFFILKACLIYLPSLFKLLKKDATKINNFFVVSLMRK